MTKYTTPWGDWVVDGYFDPSLRFTRLGFAGQVYLAGGFCGFARWLDRVRDPNDRCPKRRKAQT